MKTPIIPQYAPRLKLPVMCNSCGENVFPLVSQIPAEKSSIVIAGPGIDVDDLSDTASWRYRVSRADFVALSVVLTLVAKELSVVRTSPILKGTIIDRLELTWVYNKAIATQQLTNTLGLSEPSLGLSDIAYTYTSQIIGGDISLTITGNDDLGLPGSTAQDTKSILFGDLMWLGYGASQENVSASAIETFIEGLQTHNTVSSRVTSYFATGLANQKHFVAYPKAYGLGLFTKGIFTGGYVRLKKVGTIIKSTLGDSDIESDIIFTNSKGYSQAYYIYESLFDNQEDNITPFIIS